FPRACNTGYDRLATELAVGTDFACNTRDFAGEAVQLVHHRIDGVFQLENFSLHVYCDLARQVASRHCGRHFGDVTHLGGEVGRHEVHGVREVLPRATHARHDGLTTETSVRSYFSRNACDFRCERVELIDHGVERVLELQDLALHVHGDLA